MNFNYTFYAIEDLNKLISHPIYKKDRKEILSLIELLKNSIKYILPDGGRLLDVEPKRSDIDLFRLPYPIIALEYYISNGDLDKNMPLVSPKRICLASDSSYFENVENDGIYIWSIYWASKFGSWLPAPCCAFISRSPVEGEKLSFPGKIPEGFKKIDIQIDLITSLKNAAKMYSTHEIYMDLIDEINSMLCFLAAKSCSNVIEVDNRPNTKINAKRAKKGKLPFYSYKTLKIKLPVERAKTNPQGNGKEKRKSPRLHLRQGHRRHLSNGKKIWINHCIVGSKHGIVNKDYKYSDRPENPKDF